jgi:hypothetical protein
MVSKRLLFLKQGPDYYMFYGSWEHTCMAKSRDGKTFARQLMPNE